jgi:hypothetical protein
MDSQIIQDLRSKLEKRIKRLNSVEMDFFLPILKQFWAFFDDHPIYRSLGDVLSASYPEAKAIAKSVLNGENQFSEIEGENAAMSYHVLRLILEKCEENNLFNFHTFQECVWDIACAYTGGNSGRIPNNVPEAFEKFRDIFIYTFYTYLDEQLDQRSAILGLLLRYKHRCEWFYREDLNQIAQGDSRKAEKLLSMNLYSYLHDQGLNFHIEPSSITGEIDLIAAQGSNDPLLADAKVFDADGRDKRYIRKGFNQIYTYTQQYNEPCGYLIIFRITDRDLHFSLPQQFHGIPAITYNHKTIFLITIDICHHEKSVSQRKPLEAITITQEDLISEVEESEDGTGDLVR